MKVNRVPKMTFTRFKNLFTFIKSEIEKRDEYLSIIPADIRDAFFDNAYVSSLSIVNDRLMSNIFPEVLQKDVDYFLYDHKYAAKTPSIFIDSGGKRREYIIDCLDDIFDYFILEYEFIGE